MTLKVDTAILSSGEQAVNSQLGEDVGRGHYKAEDGINTYFHNTSGITVIGQDHGEERTWATRSQGAQSSGYDGSGEQTVSGGGISQDNLESRRSGSVLPPRLPSRTLKEVNTRGFVYDIHNNPNKETGLTDVLRKVATTKVIDKEGRATTARQDVIGAKSTSHAPKGHESQEYHVRFKDKGREERYGELVMKLATKRVNKATKGGGNETLSMVA